MHYDGLAHQISRSLIVDDRCTPPSQKQRDAGLLPSWSALKVFGPSYFFFSFVIFYTCAKCTFNNINDQAVSTFLFSQGDRRSTSNSDFTKGFSYPHFNLQLDLSFVSSSALIFKRFGVYRDRLPTPFLHADFTALQ